MDRSGIQRLIPIILVLVVVGLVIAALVSIGRTFFGGGGSTSPSSSPAVQVNAGKQALTNTASDQSVVMNVRGPLVADEKFQAYSITITPSSRNMTTYQGYSGKQVSNEPLSNSQTAYTQLVYALSRAKLMDGKPLTGNANDERGICATGSVYEFEVLQGSNSIQKLWTSTCAGSPGSLKANLTQVTTLFEDQIPDFGVQLEKLNTATNS